MRHTKQAKAAEKQFWKEDFPMKELEQKVAYLQGLADGMQLEESKEGKVIGEMLKVMAVMLEQIESLADQIDDLDEYCEELDADLADVEELLYEEDCDCDCEGCEGPDCEDCDEECCEDCECAACCGDDEDYVEVTAEDIATAMAILTSIKVENK